MTIKTFLTTIALLFSLVNQGQNIDSLKINTVQFSKITNHLEYGFKKPKTFEMIRYIPNDLVSFGKFVIQKENLKWDGIVLGSTLALMPFDQKITNEGIKIGNKIGGWDEDSHFTRIMGIEIFPKSISAGVYSLGEKNTTLLLSGMFYAIGKIGKEDYRALNTSNELVEVILSVGVATQTMKRITGRQSPRPAIRDGNDGGAWNPFPSFSGYHRNKLEYDAMPSGHMATFMATLTVIATNYPEIKWIKPVGYSLGGVLAANMISQRLHWASDYPIGIFMGYVIGKTIADRRIIKKETATGIHEKKTIYKTNYSFYQINNGNLIGATITF